MASAALSCSFVNSFQNLPHLCPRVSLNREPPDAAAIVFQILVNRARKVVANRPRHISRILGPAEESGLVLDDVVPERTHIGRDHRESEAVAQQTHPALENF